MDVLGIISLFPWALHFCPLNLFKVSFSVYILLSVNAKPFPEVHATGLVFAAGLPSLCYSTSQGPVSLSLRWCCHLPSPVPPLRFCLCSRRILLNYAVFNPTIGYSQGMSDLVAPLLAEVLDESDTSWCFVGLMQNTIFISSPRDEDMEKQLVRLSAGLPSALSRLLLSPVPWAGAFQHAKSHSKALG